MADPNSIPISATAKNIICSYPFLKIRADMGFNEYYEYKKAWDTFNTVWGYNYTTSTLNSTGANLNYYQFPNGYSFASYSNGQLAHTAVYPKAAANGVFNNII